MCTFLYIGTDLLVWQLTNSRLVPEVEVRKISGTHQGKAAISNAKTTNMLSEPRQA
jgi:hypothetical protein